MDKKSVHSKTPLLANRAKLLSYKLALRAYNKWLINLLELCRNELTDKDLLSCYNLKQLRSR